MLTSQCLRTVAAALLVVAAGLIPTGAGAESAGSGAPITTGATPPPETAKPAEAAKATEPAAAAPTKAQGPEAPSPAGSDSAEKPAEAPQSPVANAATPPPPAAAAPPPESAAKPAAPAEGAAASPAEPPAPAAAPPSPAAAAPAAPPAPVVDPVIQATRLWLGDAANTGKSAKEDVAAAAAFYGARNDQPLWVDRGGFTAKAKSAMDEVRKADDWGLSAAAFDLPALGESAPTPEALAAAEAKLTLALLKYVRFARGGRINPQSLSRILDLTPPLKDPTVVLAELAAAVAPDAYLRDQHPKHPEFQKLHKALLKARGPAEPAVEIDPALKVALPETKATLKRGVDAPEVALLRRRLKVPAEAGASETFFDEKLELALKAYQVEKGFRATGQLSRATRLALNREGEALTSPSPEAGTQRIVINMERWRWMPENLGRVFVWNNIPEYTTRVVKNHEVIFKERIIVGLPQWATPVFSETMKSIVFNPSWGMPDGIKVRELQPRLRAAGGGFLFFGGGGGGSIIRAYGLDVYRGGRKIDPDSVDWTSADLRQYSFVQPPGGKNPLGVVKFLFPNRHDVYMHDTIERQLFAQPNRALSHGCIRVQDPRRFAAIMLAEGNGLDADGVARAIAGGGEIALKSPIPVHMTYFTAIADAEGRVSTFSDIYGHDSRLAAALTGRALRPDPSLEAAPEVVAADEMPVGPQGNKKKKKSVAPPDTLADVISGFWLN